MPKKILLADDSLTIQKVVELTFSEEDYEVVVVGDGEQAIQQLESEAPDIVLADVVMPKKTGYDVCEAVKRRTPHIPVILLVGKFEPFDQERAKRVGAEAHILKPFESNVLVKTVMQLLAAVPGGGGAAAASPAATTFMPAAPVPLRAEEPAAVAAPAFVPEPSPFAAEPAEAPPELDAELGAAPAFAEEPVFAAEAPPLDEHGPMGGGHGFGEAAAFADPEGLAEAEGVDLPPIGSSAFAHGPAFADPEPLAGEAPLAPPWGGGSPAVDLQPPRRASDTAEVDRPEVSSGFQALVDDEPLGGLDPLVPAAIEASGFDQATAEESPFGADAPLEPEPARQEREERPERIGASPRAAIVAAAAEAMGGAMPSGIALEDFPDDILDAIVERVVRRLSDEVVRDIAWQVVPELAELLIKKKLEELG